MRKSVDAMRRARRRAASLVALIAAGSVASALAITPGAVAAGGPTEHLSLLLAPTNEAVFNSLLTRHDLTQQQRGAILRGLTPSPSVRSAVVRDVQAMGLHIDRVTPWLIDASGSQTIVAPALNATTSSRGMSLPRDPRFNSPLWASVGSAVGSIAVSDGRARLRPMSSAETQTGPMLRSLYSSPDTTASSKFTVATLQFSGWDNSSLSTYAANKSSGLGLATSPVSTGQYKAVSVDGADPTTPDGTGGDFEVALDQEAILAAAPHAYQRAYFAPNNDQGEIDALNQVYADAINAQSVHPIVALSISWGSCEQAGGDIAGIEAAIEKVVAAGVTVFAASGDNGSTDCNAGAKAGDPFFNVPAVDSPASDPLVVAVGGTTVNSDHTQSGWGGTHNDGSSFGSGGGTSLLHPLPSYQSDKGLTGSGRLVPDIATDADPASGLSMYFYDPSNSSGSWVFGGGTSLASPLAAALMTNALAAQGFAGGVGDIHSLLYGANASDFVDITSGSNGYPATPKYDLVTGLGTPLWSKFDFSVLQVLRPKFIAPAYSKTRAIAVSVTVPGGSASGYPKWSYGIAPAQSVPLDCTNSLLSAIPSTFTTTADGPATLWIAEAQSSTICNIATARTIVDTQAPTAKATAALAAPNTSSIAVTWSGTDKYGVAGVRIDALRVGSKQVNTVRDIGSAGRTTFAVLPGATYSITVRTSDRAGNESSPITTTVTTPLDDRVFSLRGWTLRPNSHAYLGSWSSSSSPAASATKVVRASTYAVQVATCPVCGRLGAYINGRLVKAIDTYSAGNRYNVSVVVYRGTSAARTVTIRPLGSHSAKSKGNTVQFDALLATP